MHNNPNYYHPHYNQPNQNAYRPDEASTTALRLAIINFSPLFNKVAADEVFASNLVMALETGNVNKVNELIQKLSQQCMYSPNNGFCCVAGGKQVCMNFTIK
ncbi:hypothetical protein QC477_005423 [Bacillus cereus]|uniref:hypothetical protein n=1 Tax=Bacillus cereus group TaxID=86661 RepID=UPI000B4B47B1|nr:MULTISPECIES: hypothetical protein [Bacillus cereus group]EKS7857904.1 hypothetical protein [Bacillus cereus]EKS8379433.1 hypothetical protein [Bacillus cereus]EKS8384953.1 hypothetical protein [Bacillus cereus]MBD8076831.1 hypothetical protein [Bacillus thuringiensis]